MSSSAPSSSAPPPSAPPPAAARTPLPEDGESFFEKYMIRDPVVVRARLQALIDQRCMLAAADEAGASTMVTAPLAVDAESLWVDVPPTEAVLHRLLASARLSFDGVFERVTLRFRCGPALLDLHDGRPALRLPLPTRLLHLQRREYLRRAPPSDALQCQLPWTDAAGQIHCTIASVRDLSGGGLALAVADDAIALAQGDLLPGCSIALPDTSTIEFTLRIQHIDHVDVRGKPVRRAGCEFIDLRADMQSRLFRYIMQLDRERVARQRERE